VRKQHIGRQLFRKVEFLEGRTTGGFFLAGAAICNFSLALFAKGSKGQDSAKPERFDSLVREGFFAGFTGDSEAFARGMKKCEEALAKNPKDAEALVWHGSGLSYQAKATFTAGDAEKGRKIRAQADEEMNDAVNMRPDDVAVLIPRASITLSAALHVPTPELAKKNFQVATTDYEKILRLESPAFSKLPIHSRGELLGGLAEAWNGLGDKEKSKAYLQRMVVELPNTAYSNQANEILSAPSRTGALGTTCLGCHMGTAQ
jgi:tetratricopeptide (TPR) repeat protein